MDKARLSHEVAGSLLLLEEELRSFSANMTAGTYRKAVHNLYYAAFNAGAALLWSRGIESDKTHDGVLSLISLHFVKAGALSRDSGARLNELMAARHAADYKGAIPIELSDVRKYHPWVARFAGQAMALIKAGGVKVDTRTIDASLSRFSAAKSGGRRKEN